MSSIQHASNRAIPLPVWICTRKLTVLLICSTHALIHSLRSSMATCFGSSLLPFSRPTLEKSFTFMSFSHSLKRSIRRSIVALLSASVCLSLTSLSLALRSHTGVQDCCSAQASNFGFTNYVKRCIILIFSARLRFTRHGSIHPA